MKLARAAALAGTGDKLRPLEERRSDSLYAALNGPVASSGFTAEEVDRRVRERVASVGETASRRSGTALEDEEVAENGPVTIVAGRAPFWLEEGAAEAEAAGTKGGARGAGGAGNDDAAAPAVRDVRDLLLTGDALAGASTSASPASSAAEATEAAAFSAASLAARF